MNEQGKILAKAAAEVVLFIACPPPGMRVDYAMRWITDQLTNAMAEAAKLEGK